MDHGSCPRLRRKQNTTNHNQSYVPPTPQTLTPGQLFANQLTSQLYASLANQITQAIFGQNAQTSGTYSFQGTTITFNRVGNNINITINDGQTVTNITV